MAEETEERLSTAAVARVTIVETFMMKMLRSECKVIASPASKSRREAVDDKV
jgi:hypothetical protein